ncbi:MAG TPA: prepilin-type N-terminal cleavage/methylation domain-containing protein [Thermodesulfobacteriota bacterium]|nr:prepilin-type N-terminal cleavage/methylation domain-containing protein [Deltaproteobacteria bacterium]HNR13163.1 prepilin-type N-terminal cleavage/methylation domain-containing protein [Thermodesulfobacteriota bacterium]HNU71677.1 prepilin-type N-terminal cleavage/methylation domain-containing protein [Thermodesulfobacteriota bacterium]
MAAQIRNDCDKGFTLLELLLTMAILVLIVGIMGTTFQLAVRSWEKGDKHAEEFRRTRIVMDLIAQQVKSFYPYVAKEDDHYRIAFEGTNTSLQFVSVQSLRIHLITGLKWVHYYLDDGGESGNSLFVQETAVTGEDFLEQIEEGSAEQGEAVRLLPGVENIAFEYYVVPKETEEEDDNTESALQGEWMDAWSWEETEEERIETAGERNREEDSKEELLLKAIRITITQAAPEEEGSEPITTAMTIPLVADSERGTGLQETPFGPAGGGIPRYPSPSGGSPPGNPFFPR